MRVYRISLGIRVLALLIACGGCWEEIHYVPKPGGVRIAEQSPEEEVPLAAAEASTVAEESVAEAAPSPGAAELFGSTEPAPAAAVEGGDTPSEAAFAEDSILPTANGLAANLEPAGEGAGGETPRLAATGEERWLIWEAASKWSLAAAFHAKGRDAQRDANLNGARTAAATLDVELPQLPAVAQADMFQAAVIEELRGESAVALTNAFAKRFGAAEAAVADLAIRSHLLLLTYSPRGGDAALHAEALRRAAEASGLPAETWTPLVTLLDERAPFIEVRQAVFEQDKRVAEHFEPASGGTP